MQSKKNSFIESITQTSIGLIISFVMQLTIFPLLNIPVSLKQNLIISGLFFIASIIRGYIIRRLFNKNIN